MNATEIAALCTGIPTVLAAIGALIQTTRTKGVATKTLNHAAAIRGLVEANAYSINKPAQTFPAPPSNEPV